MGGNLEHKPNLSDREGDKEPCVLEGVIQVCLGGCAAWQLHRIPIHNPVKKELLLNQSTAVFKSPQEVAVEGRKKERQKEEDVCVHTVGMRMGNMIASTKRLNDASQTDRWRRLRSAGVSNTP